MLKPRYMVVVRCDHFGDDVYRIVNGPFERLIDAENFIDTNSRYYGPLEVLQTWAK